MHFNALFVEKVSGIHWSDIIFSRVRNCTSLHVLLLLVNARLPYNAAFLQCLITAQAKQVVALDPLLIGAPNLITLFRKKISKLQLFSQKKKLFCLIFSCIVISNGNSSNILPLPPQKIFLIKSKVSIKPPGH